MMKHVKPKRRSAQYDHMQGNPLDPANHPSTSVPDATVPYSGESQAYSNPAMRPDSMSDFDNSVG